MEKVRDVFAVEALDEELLAVDDLERTRRKPLSYTVIVLKTHTNIKRYTLKGILQEIKLR